MPQLALQELITRLNDGHLVPYLGPGALAGVHDTITGAPIPADSDSLILAMNDGSPMALRLMYEFPRAAMSVELKRGRKSVEQFLTRTYAEKSWTPAPLHAWLADLKLPYVIDTNRDMQLQTGYAETPHTLLVGLARIGGTDYRFRLYHYDGRAYGAIDQDAVDTSLPILFKPLGTPLPMPAYIASDADYVDYITELMGGFAVPAFVKEYRRNKQYLFLGMRFTRDTERMIVTELTYAAGSPRGWALIENATDKERRFCERMDIIVVDGSVEALLKASAG